MAFKSDLGFVPSSTQLNPSSITLIQETSNDMESKKSTGLLIKSPLVSTAHEDKSPKQSLIPQIKQATTPVSAGTITFRQKTQENKNLEINGHSEVVLSSPGKSSDQDRISYSGDIREIIRELVREETSKILERTEKILDKMEDNYDNMMRHNFNFKLEMFKEFSVLSVS